MNDVLDLFPEKGAQDDRAAQRFGIAVAGKLDDLRTNDEAHGVAARDGGACGPRDDVTAQRADR